MPAQGFSDPRTGCWLPVVSALLHENTPPLGCKTDVRVGQEWFGRAIPLQHTIGKLESLVPMKDAKGRLCCCCQPTCSEGGAPDTGRARRGDLATYPDEATVRTTMGFFLRKGCFWRG